MPMRALETPTTAIPWQPSSTTEKLTGCEVERAYVDKGYRGHETANPRRVFISGQKRGVFGAIKHELHADPPLKPSSAI